MILVVAVLNALVIGLLLKGFAAVLRIEQRSWGRCAAAAFFALAVVIPLQQFGIVTGAFPLFAIQLLAFTAAITVCLEAPVVKAGLIGLVFSLVVSVQVSLRQDETPPQNAQSVRPD